MTNKLVHNQYSFQYNIRQSIGILLAYSFIIFLQTSCNIDNKDAAKVQDVTVIEKYPYSEENISLAYPDDLKVALIDPEMPRSIALSIYPNSWDTLNILKNLNSIQIRNLYDVTESDFLCGIEPISRNISNFDIIYDSNWKKIPDEIELLENLEHLEVDILLTSISRNLYKLRRLKSVNFVSKVPLDSELVFLDSIEFLSVSCIDQNFLPDFISDMKSVRVLSLDSQIEFLPRGIKKMENLIEISANCTELLEKVRKDKNKAKTLDSLHSLLPKDCRLVFTVP